ncbi:MAG: GTPase Era [Patescibacteria group bacterium]
MTEPTPPHPYKCGIVVLIGRSNVGKSTLLNALVGEKVAPVSPLPQTTRQPVQGVLTTDEGQLVFVDTPGLLKGSKDKITGRINQTIKESLEGVDLVLYVADPTRMIGEEERALLAMVRPLPIPKLLVINKSEIADAPYGEDYRDLREDFAAIMEVSALTGSGLKVLVNECLARLPEGVMLYPPEEKTNISHTRWIEEMIREKLYYYLHKEVPYTATVRVEEINERANKVLYIRAVVVTTDARYRKMIIGHGAQRIKEIGTAARKELSLALNRPVYLDLTVDVDTHWMTRME